LLMFIPPAVPAGEPPINIRSIHITAVLSLKAAFDQAALRDSTAVICILLMFIGGSPAGTAGGIKTTTFATLWMVLLNEIRGNEDIVVFKRRVRFSVIRKAIAILMIGVLWVAFVIFMMLI